MIIQHGIEVDDDIGDWLLTIPIHMSSCGKATETKKSFKYAEINVFVGGKTFRISLHRLLAGALHGEEVDHIDGNTFNNRRANLRRCTKHGNCQNQKKQIRSCTSKYKGVSWHKASSKWSAYIKWGGKKKHLGLYALEEDAARAYNVVAASQFGEFARLNEV